MCKEFEQTLWHYRETLMSYEIPERQWEKVAPDLFTYKNKVYLITVCHKSNFWELDCLYDTKLLAVDKKLKCHFVRYCIPKQMVGT